MDNLMNMDYKEVKLRKKSGLTVPVFSPVAAESIGFKTRHLPEKGKPKKKLVINTTVLRPPSPLPGQVRHVQPVNVQPVASTPAPSTSASRLSTKRAASSRPSTSKSSTSKPSTNKPSTSKSSTSKTSTSKSSTSKTSTPSNCKNNVPIVDVLDTKAYYEAKRKFLRTRKKIANHSTPKRVKCPHSQSLLSGNVRTVRTPENKPVIPEKDFSPIELFPESQTEEIVKWSWVSNEVKYPPLRKSIRLGYQKQAMLKRRSPSPEYIRPAKKVAPPPEKRAISALEKALLAVQAKVLQLGPVAEKAGNSSDEDDAFCDVMDFQATTVIKHDVEESDSDDEVPIIPASSQQKTGHAGASPVSQNKKCGSETESINPVAKPVAEEKPVSGEVKKPVLLIDTNIDKDEEDKFKELLGDDSMLECLIACSIQAEECRLSQQMEKNTVEVSSLQNAKPDLRMSTRSTSMNNTNPNLSTNIAQTSTSTVVSKTNVPSSGPKPVTSTFVSKASVPSTAPKPSTSTFAPKTSIISSASKPSTSTSAAPSTSTSAASSCSFNSSFSSGFSSSFPLSQSSLSVIMKHKTSSLKTITSTAMLPPRRSPRSLSLTKKASPQKHSLSPAHKLPLVLSQSTTETDFNPSWMESIKNAASPLHSSLSNKSMNESMSQKTSQSATKTSIGDSKSISRTLFTSPQNSKLQSKISKDKAEKKCENKSESSNILSPTDKANKSFDPFEDSFDTAFEDIDLEKMEAELLSQLEHPKEDEKKVISANNNKNAVASTVSSQSENTRKSTSSFQSSFLPSQDKNALLVSTVSSSQTRGQVTSGCQSNQRQQNTTTSWQSYKHGSVPLAQNLPTTIVQPKSSSFPASSSFNKPSNLVNQNKTSTWGKSNSSTNINSGNQSNCNSVQKVVENQVKPLNNGTTSPWSNTTTTLTSGVITNKPPVTSNNTFQHKNTTINKPQTTQSFNSSEVRNNNSTVNKPVSSINVPPNKAVNSTVVTRNMQVPCNTLQNKTVNLNANNKPMSSNNNIVASSVVQNKPSTIVNNNRTNAFQNSTTSTAQGNRPPQQLNVPQAQVSNPTPTSSFKPQWKPQTNGNSIQQKPVVNVTSTVQQQKPFSKPSLPQLNPTQVPLKNNSVLPQTNTATINPSQKLNTGVNLQQSSNKQCQPQSNVNKAQCNGNATYNAGNTVSRTNPMPQSSNNNPLLSAQHTPIQVLPRNNTPLQQVSNNVNNRSNVPSSAVGVTTRNNSNSVSTNQASNPIVPKLAPVIGGSVLIRHKSADFAPVNNKPMMPNAVNQVRNNASPLMRHKSVGDFSSAQGSQVQRYSAMEIERKRQEAKQRLLQRRMQQ